MFDAHFPEKPDLYELNHKTIDNGEINKHEKSESLTHNRFKYNIGRKLFDILRNIRTKHGGDFEEYLILYALLLASDYHQMMVSSQSLDKPFIRRPQGVNLLSISDITNIPRETVRRKVAKLVAEGSITRGDDGLHYYSGNAVQDDITARILEDLPIAHEASAYGALADARRTIGKAAER
jgi:hypothetical protein